MFDVLCVADMYLLPGLKSLCGKTLAKTICEDNVLYMWKTAKLFRLSRLEDHCTEFMARIIERVSVRVPVLTVEGELCFGWNKTGDIKFTVYVLVLLCVN